MTAFWRYGPGPSTDASQPARAVLDADVSEADFQAAVVELAMWRGWRVHAERPARTSKGWRTPVQGDVGYPDITLCRPPRLIHAELKSQHGVMGDNQLLWREVLMGVPGVEYYLWRPAAFPEIEATLR